MQQSLEPITRVELRQFGLVMAGMFILFFGLLLPWLRDAAWPLWPWYVAAVFALAGTLAPGALRPVHTLWMKVGHVLGWINTRVLLSVLYFVMVVPVGALLHVFGRDPMQRLFDKQAQTYRVSSQARAAQDLEKPF